MLYTNWNYYLLRKPHWIASTFGPQQSILDYFQTPEQLQSIIQKDSDFDKYSQFCYLEDFTKCDFVIFINNQISQFTKEQEFWLLNRLDNDTGGFLYFAKNPQIYSFYKEQQHQWEIQKMYLAEVQGNPFFKTDKQSMVIDSPIMHHRFDDQKMIVITDKEDENKWRWDCHKVSTTIELIRHDKIQNTSLLSVMINKWIRHQIRVHCKSIGAPILWDIIYWPKPPLSDFLHLWSIGMKN